MTSLIKLGIRSLIQLSKKSPVCLSDSIRGLHHVRLGNNWESPSFAEGLLKRLPIPRDVGAISHEKLRRIFTTSILLRNQNSKSTRK